MTFSRWRLWYWCYDHYHIVQPFWLVLVSFGSSVIAGRILGHHDIGYAPGLMALLAGVAIFSVMLYGQQKVQNLHMAIKAQALRKYRQGGSMSADSARPGNL